MTARILSLVAACAVLLFFLHREDKAGGLDAINRTFLDWLVANSSEKIHDPELTFLRLTDVDATVFESWPHSQLDYAVILRNLERYQPEIVMFVPTLGWRSDDEITTGALRTQLLRVPQPLLGCVLQDNPVAAAVAPESDPFRFLDTVPNVTGDIEAIPGVTGLLTLPEEDFLPGASIAFTHIDLGPEEDAGPLRVPLLARRGTEVVPSFILRAILLQNDRPVEDLDVSLGNSITIRDTGITIPIDAAGYLTVFPGMRERIPRVDAGALFETEADSENSASLKTNLVLVGEDHPGARRIPFGNDINISRAERIAIAIATIQSGRYISRMPVNHERGVWAAILLIGLVLLRFGRARVLGLSLLLLLFYFAASLIFFQSHLQWMSPAIPVAIILAAGLCGLIVPDHRSDITPPDDRLED